LCEKENFNLLSFLNNIERLFSHQLKSKGLVLNTSYQFDEMLSLSFSKDLLLQVLVNLLGNACKFTDAGSINLSVKVLSVSADTSIRLRFSVADTGCGLKGAAFSPAKGNGMGLTLCKEILTQLGGFLEMETNEDDGTTASFCLDCSLAVDLSAYDEPADSAIGKHALYIDDTPLNREIVVDLLDHVGISCDALPDGESAINLYLHMPKHHYDIMLIDANLPVMSGFSAAKILAYYLKETCPLVLVSGLRRDSLQEELSGTLFSAFLEKPFTPASFYKVVGNCFGIRNLNPVRASFQEILNRHKLKFLEDYKKSDDTMYHLLHQQNFEELRIYAHSIRGLAAMLQLPMVAHAAGQLETLLNEGHHEVRPAIETYSRALKTIFSMNSLNQQFG
ncbi:MAG: response regulator, partial [Anaerovorax sp.]